MLAVDRKFHLLSFLIMSGINLAVYFVYHLAYHIDQYWFDLVADYVMDAWECLLPAISALLMLIVRSRLGSRPPLVYGLLLSLARLFYSVPFYYLYFMTCVTSPDSLYSILTSLLCSVLVFVTNYLHIFVLYSVGVLIYRHKSENGVPSLGDMLKEKKSFEFKSGASLIIFALSMIQFLYALRVPIIATVNYFGEWGFSIRTAELIHMLFNYAFVLGLLALCYAVLCKLKNSILKEKADKEAENRG